MFNTHLKYTEAIRRVVIFCIALCLTGAVFAQSDVQAISVVQSGDRTSLNPLSSQPGNQNFVFPNVIRKNGSLVVFTARQFDVLEMISGNGTLVLQENIKGRTGRFDVPLKAGSSGINYVRLRNKESTLIQKVVIIE